MFNTLKNIALFFIAPFVGLAYIVTLPIVGVGYFVYLGGKKILAPKSWNGTTVTTFRGWGPATERLGY